MNAFSFRFESPHPTVLLLGAHCDDIEIGCGGTLLSWAAKYPRARFVWVTLSAGAGRADETREAARSLLEGISDVQVHVEDFRMSYFPHCGPELKDYFEGLKQHRPELILTHFRHDLHQDHRVVNELTWNTFRDHAILEYEIPKFDGDIAVPNVYQVLSRETVQRKCEILMRCFPSQHSRNWFTAETFSALARLRGIECGAPEGYAEAFYGRKICLAA
jgi:LmbE family N-acetylglucosaminyl deacetylase